MKKTVKQSISTKRVAEIESIQDRIKKLGEQFQKDFSEPLAISGAINKDLQAAIDSLELLKGVYRSKTEGS